MKEYELSTVEDVGTILWKIFGSRFNGTVPWTFQDNSDEVVESLILSLRFCQHQYQISISASILLSECISNVRFKERYLFKNTRAIFFFLFLSSSLLFLFLVRQTFNDKLKQKILFSFLMNSSNVEFCTTSKMKTKKNWESMTLDKVSFKRDRKLKKKCKSTE